MSKFNRERKHFTRRGRAKREKLSQAETLLYGYAFHQQMEEWFKRRQLSIPLKEEDQWKNQGDTMNPKS